MSRSNLVLILDWLSPLGTVVLFRMWSVASREPRRPSAKPVPMCCYDLQAGVSTHSHVRMPRRLSRIRYGEPGRSRLSVKGFATLSGPNWRPSCRQSRHPDRSIESPGHVVIAARLVSSAVSRSGHVITPATEEGPGRQ